MNNSISLLIYCQLVIMANRKSNDLALFCSNKTLYYQCKTESQFGLLLAI